MTTSREFRLARRPDGAAVPEDFELAEVAVRDPGPGEVTVTNLVMSVDPYMRGRMNDVPSYAPPYALGEVMYGGAVGRVTASRDPALAEGTLVRSNNGWREAFTAPAAHLEALPEPPSGVGVGAYLGVLGMPGLTAWGGVTVIAPVAEGDVVFVSAATGAVGSVAGQLARARGASRVVGSAGSPAKVAAVTEVFGFDAAFTHLDNDTPAHLAEVAPDGIDMYFDNVGGEQLQAAVWALRMHGRVALCGSISNRYTGRGGSGVDLASAVGKRLTLRGFIVSDVADRAAEFRDEVGGLLADGRIALRETVFTGLPAAVPAFLGLFSGGDQLGKVLVSLE